VIADRLGEGGWLVDRLYSGYHAGSSASVQSSRQANSVRWAGSFICSHLQAGPPVFGQ
jgi:hypothetical protein